MVLFGTVNQAMFDWPWSGIHLVSGLCVGALLAILVYQRRPGRFWTVGIGLLALWEIIEKTLQYLDVHAHQTIAPLKQAVGSFAFAPETVANTTGDMIIGTAGMLIGLIMIRRIIRKP